MRNLAKGISRHLVARLLSGSMPYYIVNEYPKSGGTWLTQLISEAIELPYRRNGFPTLEPSVIHGHFFNPWGLNNVVILWRDGRDVMVSWYHHCLFRINEHNEELVRQVRTALGSRDYDNVRENLADFIEFSFSRQKHPHFSWSEFVRRWYGRGDVVYVRYEDLLAETSGELDRIFTELCGRKLEPSRLNEIVARNSFEKASGRKPGEENKSSFLRRGIAGDWRNYFNDEAMDLFHHHAGAELQLLGYPDS